MTIVLSSTSATPVATTVPTAIAPSCCSPCANDRYTVDSTRTTATHGATNAIGAASHQPATAHATQAASAALPACTTRSRSRPGPAHAHRSVCTAAAPRRRTSRPALPVHSMPHQVPRQRRHVPTDGDFLWRTDIDATTDDPDVTVERPLDPPKNGARPPPWWPRAPWRGHRRDRRIRRHPMPSSLRRRAPRRATSGAGIGHGPVKAAVTVASSRGSHARLAREVSGCGLSG